VIRRLRFDLKRAAGTFLFLAAVAGLLAVTSTIPSPRAGALIVGAVIVLSAVAGFTRSLLFIPPEVARPVRFRCTLCSAAHLREANKLAAQYYGRDRLPSTLVESWRQKNPFAFACLLTDDGSLEAAFGTIAVSQSFMDQFIVGNVVESQLSANDVLTWEDTRRADRIYISGVVVKDAGTWRGHERAQVLVWAMLRYFTQFFDRGVLRRLYALAATGEGELLLKGLGFELEVPAETRRDRHNLYCAHVADTWIDDIESRLPDYAHICSFDIAYSPSAEES
jgi:hypothetical protein